MDMKELRAKASLMGLRVEYECSFGLVISSPTKEIMLVSDFGDILYKSYYSDFEVADAGGLVHIRNKSSHVVYSLLIRDDVIDIKETLLARLYDIFDVEGIAAILETFDRIRTINVEHEVSASILKYNFNGDKKDETGFSTKAMHDGTRGILLKSGRIHVMKADSSGLLCENLVYGDIDRNIGTKTILDAKYMKNGKMNIACSPVFIEGEESRNLMIMCQYNSETDGIRVKYPTAGIIKAIRSYNKAGTDNDYRVSTVCFCKVRMLGIHNDGLSRFFAIGEYNKDTEGKYGVIYLGYGIFYVSCIDTTSKDVSLIYNSNIDKVIQVEDFSWMKFKVQKNTSGLHVVTLTASEDPRFYQRDYMQEYNQTIYKCGDKHCGIDYSIEYAPDKMRMLEMKPVDVHGRLLLLKDEKRCVILNEYDHEVDLWQEYV